MNSERLFRKCKNDIQIKPLFKSSSTLKVYCPDEDGWKLAVRTKTKERIKSPRNRDACSPDVLMQENNSATLRAVRRDAEQQRRIRRRPLEACNCNQAE